MEPLSFNTCVVQLSSTPPIVGSPVTSFFTIATIQGITTVHLDYNLLNFSVKPFKTIITWNQLPGGTQIFNSNFNPLSTITPNNSATSKYTFIPTTNLQSFTSNVMMYYQNGVIHNFNLAFNMLADNIIDQDIRLLDTQIIDKENMTTFNLESQSKNVVYNQLG